MKISKQYRSLLFTVLNVISEYYPDLEPLRLDTDEDLLYKYFYWVDEYNSGHDPRHLPRPEFV